MRILQAVFHSAFGQHELGSNSDLFLVPFDSAICGEHSYVHAQSPIPKAKEYF